MRPRDLDKLFISFSYATEPAMDEFLGTRIRWGTSSLLELTVYFLLASVPISTAERAARGRKQFTQGRYTGSHQQSSIYQQVFGQRPSTPKK